VAKIHAPASRAKIRNIMSAVYLHGIRVIPHLFKVILAASHGFPSRIVWVRCRDFAPRVAKRTGNHYRPHDQSQREAGFTVHDYRAGWAPKSRQHACVGYEPNLANVRLFASAFAEG